MIFRVSLEKTTAIRERSNFAYMQLTYDIGISYTKNPERGLCMHFRELVVFEPSLVQNDNVQ